MKVIENAYKGYNIQHLDCNKIDTTLKFITSEDHKPVYKGFSMKQMRY